MTPQDIVHQMQLAGLGAPEKALRFGTEKPQRFGPKNAHWYQLREVRTDSGRYIVLGSFGSWKTGEKHRVEVDWQGINEAERAELAAKRQVQAEADARAREAAAARAAMTAGELWAAASRTGSSEYLKRKGVDAEACRFLPDGSLVIPLLRYDLPREDALRGVQQIFTDGSKRFTKGLAKPGVCLRLGLVQVGEPLLVCEGYATGLTLRMAVGKRLPVFVALDAGNLMPVCELLRALYPRSRILICADDDYRTPSNPGREKAHKVSRAVERSAYVYPVFLPRMRGPKDTDFNDLHIGFGLNVVQRQLRHVLPLLGSEILNAA
jgi:putative DNA primase/helicase